MLESAEKKQGSFIDKIKNNRPLSCAIVVMGVVLVPLILIFGAVSCASGMVFLGIVLFVLIVPVAGIIAAVEEMRN